MTTVLDLPAPAAPKAPRTNTLAEGVLIILAMTVVQRLVGFVRGILFCRWLDADQLGQWDLSFSFLMIAAPLAVLGIPGSFGRYVEYYRQQGQLRSFLGRTSTCVALLGLAAMTLIWFGRAWISDVLYGRQASDRLLALLAFGLGAVIAMNSLLSLFTALRMNLVVSLMHFLNGLTFAAIGCGLLSVGDSEAATIVQAFDIACVATSAVCIWLLSKTYRSLPQDHVACSTGTFWVKLLPFAGWFWLGNLLANLFETTDRYMLVHHSGLSSDAALALVGQYHSSRLMPLLLVGISDLLSAMITPHLSQAWEAGRSDEVSRRLNFILKAAGLGLMAMAVSVGLVAPWLFTQVLGGKYAAGLAVLPMALAWCLWHGLAMIAHNYLWCAERARLVSVSLVLGLIVNVALNLVWLPIWGLHGTVLATAVSHALALGVEYWIACRQGLRFDAGTLLVLVLPAAFLAGAWIALAALLLLVVTATLSQTIFKEEEKERLWTMISGWRGLD